MFGLLVIVAFLIYIGIAIAAISLTVKVTRTYGARSWVTTILVLSVLGLFTLLPNRNWERLVAAILVPKLCAEQGESKVMRTVPKVEGLIFGGNPGESWLWYGGYSYAEWRGDDGLWRINAQRFKGEPYKIDKFSAQYEVQRPKGGSKKVGWGVEMLETVIVDRQSNEVLSIGRGFRYPDRNPSNLIDWFAIPISWIIPIQDCGALDHPNLVERTLVSAHGRRSYQQAP